MSFHEWILLQLIFLKSFIIFKYGNYISIYSLKLINKFIWVRVESKPQYNNFLDSIYLDPMEIIFENITRLAHLRIYLFILLTLVDWSLINFHQLKSDKIENVSLTYLTP